ncbi:MAG: isochorismate synthase [Bifidobacteriaceae bacterium]|jgi:menaquinone-specific isochorismate synthase|nr:isochorismate synthase [Bifidobacteriaceae bacterium]
MLPNITFRTTSAALPPNLLDAVPAPDPLVWLRRGDGFVGWGEAARCETAGPRRFQAAEDWWRAVLARAAIEGPADRPGLGPLALGSFAFSPASAAPSVLVVPRVLVARYRGREWITTASADGSDPREDSRLAPGREDAAFPPPRQPSGPVRAGGVDRSGPPAPAEHADHALPPAPLPLLRVWQEGGRRRDRDALPPAPLPPLRESTGPVSAAAWPEVVRRAMALIAAGGIEKVVLARSVLARALEGAIDPRPVLAFLADRYRDTWTFSVDGLIGATPELLIRSSRGLVTSRVLAGTIRRGDCDQANLARAAALARSSKDLEEHEFAVASVVAALEPFVEELSVPDAPSVLHLPNVMHLATDVVGELKRTRSGRAHGALELAAALHPSAAVCGTPKAEAAQVIGQLEGLDRGRYSGPVGWIDANGAGEWGIALRCAELSADRREARLWAGGGIVAASDPDAELAETEAKLAPMRQALGLAPSTP